jgi:hypothetical protein
MTSRELSPPIDGCCGAVPRIGSGRDSPQRKVRVLSREVSAMKSRITMVFCLALVVLPLPSRANVWDLAADFSPTQNPTGPWSYGWRVAPDQPLILYTDHGTRCGAPGELETWVHYIEDWCPNVTRNPHGYGVPCDEMVYPPHKVVFHPGPAQQCVVRWTAPADQSVTVTADFTSIDSGSKIVYVYVDGTQVYTATLSGVGPTGDYTATISVHAGEQVECAVSPISFYYNSTQLDFLIEANGPTAVARKTFGQVKALFR